MLSMQIDRLRETANEVSRTELTDRISTPWMHNKLAPMLREAAATIWQLRDDLQWANAENAKLRTFIGGGSIVTDYWKDEDGTMHVLTTDGEHTYEYMRGGLAAENEKLRELVRCLVYATNPLDRATLIANAAELGIEVDG